MATIRALHTIMFPERIVAPGELISADEDIAAKLVANGHAVRIAEPAADADPEPEAAADVPPVVRAIMDLVQGAPVAQVVSPAQKAPRTGRRSR